MQYSLFQIEQTFKERSWWATIASLVPSKYLTYYIANNTKITPNQVTFLSFILAIIAGGCFYSQHYICGAILYQLSYILDIVDGSLARVAQKSSAIGAFFDVFTDWLKGPILIIILLMTLDQKNVLIVILYLLFLLSLANKYNDMLFYTQQKSYTKSKSVQQSLVGKYFTFMEQKNIQGLPGMVEFEALLLFFYPIFQKDFFIYLAIGLLFALICLKIIVIYKKIK